MHDDLLFLSLFDHSRSPRDPSARVCRTDAFREYPRPRAISPDPTLARCYPGLGKRARRAEGESPSAQGVPVATLPQGVKERMRVHFDASTTLSLPSCRLAVLPSCRLAVLPSCPLAVLPSCPLAVSELECSYGSIHDADDPGLSR